MKMKLKFEPRIHSSKAFEMGVMLASFLMALLLFALFMFINGKNPLNAYKVMFWWAFANSVGLQGTFIKFVPLATIGLGLIIAFRMKLWNIGGEGQFYLGAMASTLLALFWFPKAPAVILIPLITVGGFLAGAFWGAIPGALRAYLGADEIVVTLMLNYIGILWADYLVYGPWKDPHGFNFPMTAIFPKSAWLPCLWGKVHTGIFFPVVLAFLLKFLLERTKWGFEIRVIGDNQDAARYAGMDVRKNMIFAMSLSGGLAGVAGAVYMMGVQHRLQHAFSVGYGYTAIIVAWLARLDPIATVVVAFLMGGIFVGCEILQIVMKMPISVSYIFQGILFACVLVGEVIIRYKIKLVR